MTTTEIPTVELPVNEWGEVFDALQEGDFSAEDMEYIVSTKGEDSPWHRAAQVLMTVREQIDMNHIRTGCLTVVYATETRRKRSVVTGADVLATANLLIGWHDSIETAATNILYEDYRDLNIDYLSDSGKIQLIKDHRRKHEIWLWDEDDQQLYEGIWIFYDPSPSA